MMQRDWRASSWLGIITAGAVWFPLCDYVADPTQFHEGVGKLVDQIGAVLANAGSSTLSDSDSELSDGVDIQSWGEDIFSVSEMREELERLRNEIVPQSSPDICESSGLEGAARPLCTLPALVPDLPTGVLVTDEMKTLLEAVLSPQAPPKIGFCGMGKWAHCDKLDHSAVSPRNLCAMRV